MAYSSISIKTCKFPGCPYYPKWGADGFCWRHESAESKSLKIKKAGKRTKKEYSKKLGPSCLVVANNLATVPEWFAYHMQNSERVCANCDADLSGYDYVSWHGSQHHVFEKSQFPSLKTNKLNHLVLGMWCCHSPWHSSYENASKMRVFSQAQDIVIKLYPLLPFEERKRVPIYYTIAQV